MAESYRNNENTCVVDGVEYHAVEDDRGCKACVATEDNIDNLCSRLGDCHQHRRRDGRWIVWQKTKKAESEGQASQ